MKNNLSAILGEKLLKISDVSNGTGISTTTLANVYYQRTYDFRISTLTKICDYLQIPLSELIEYEPKKEGD